MSRSPIGRNRAPVSLRLRGRGYHALRACFLVALMGLYLGHVFQVPGVPFWTAGLSHWLDPNFINVLLEHWYVSLRDGGSPASPPMYFPAPKTLAYSHGLILYVPLYVPLRIFL